LVLSWSKDSLLWDVSHFWHFVEAQAARWPWTVWWGMEKRESPDADPDPPSQLALPAPNLAGLIRAR
jgi:hypothetical protein